MKEENICFSRSEVEWSRARGGGGGGESHTGASYGGKY